MPENLAAFFTGLDAQTATFTVGGQPRLVQCFFDNAFFDRSVGETVLDTTQPRITCQMAALAGVARESLVEVAGQTFSIIQIQPEGTGLATVTLAHE
jgi:hypothetical protein